MSYKATIVSNVNKAFNLIGDLADTVVLVKKTSSSFNFNTGTASIKVGPEVTTKAVILESNKKSDDRNAMVKNLLLKTAEVGDLTVYDTVKINSIVWKIGPIINSDGYLTNVEIFKEL